MDDFEVKDNPSLRRFEADIGGDFAYIIYKHIDGQLVLIHTYVPESHRGRGIAGRLIKKVLDMVQSQNKTIKVLCPTITAYISIHPEYYSMVVEDKF